MRNALIKIFTLIFVFFFSFNIYAQYSLRMKVPYSGQQTSFWCWAASMEMIMNFHNPGNTSSISQCILAKQLYKFTSLTSPSIIDSIPCCINCTGSFNECATDNTCTTINQRKLMEKRMNATSSSSIPAYADGYDLIFSTFGYTSTQQVNNSISPFSWEQVIHQIRTCRPFIINIAATPFAGNVDGISGDHALVVTGYEEDTRPGFEKKAIITNDPWKPCCDSMETYFPYDIFLGLTPIGGTTSPADAATSYLVNRVLSVVHSIRNNLVYTDDEKNCKSCPILKDVYNGNGYFTEDPSSGNFSASTQVMKEDFLSPPVEPRNLLNLLKTNADSVVGYKNFRVNDTLYQKYISNDNYPYAPVQYIVSNSLIRRGFLGCLFPRRKLIKVVADGYEIVDMVSTNVDQNLTSTLQKVNGEWLLRKITTYTYLQKNIQVRFEGSEQTVNLNNDLTPTAVVNPTKFTLIKYFPYQYEFFSFKSNSNDQVTYMAPADNYPDLGLYKNIAYRERQVISALRGERRQLERDEIRLTNENAAYQNNLIKGKVNYLSTGQ